MLSEKSIEVLKQYYPNVVVNGDVVEAWIEIEMKDYYTKDSEVILYVGNDLYNSIVG